MPPLGRMPSENTIKGLTAAFDAMAYDVGLLAQAEYAELESVGALPGPWRQTADREPYVEVGTSDGHTVGFVRFPSLPRGQDHASDDLIQQLSQMIEAKRTGTDLIIGLCDWGWVAENDYLQRAPAALPDLLLGSGGGSGVNGRLLHDRCLWVRAYDKGRSLAEITIYEWPNRQNLFAWIDAKNYKTTSIGMNDAIKDDPRIGALFK